MNNVSDVPSFAVFRLLDRKTLTIPHHSLTIPSPVNISQTVSYHHR